MLLCCGPRATIQPRGQQTHVTAPSRSHYVIEVAAGSRVMQSRVWRLLLQNRFIRNGQADPEAQHGHRAPPLRRVERRRRRGCPIDSASPARYTRRPHQGAARATGCKGWATSCASVVLPASLGAAGVAAAREAAGAARSASAALRADCATGAANASGSTWIGGGTLAG